MTAVARVAWVDMARWVALLAMFVAHTAPPAGSFDALLMLGDYVAVALFATTIGAGAQLGADAFRPGRGRRLAGWVAGAAVRGGLLVLLGLVAEQFEAQIVGVLFHLGALTLVACLVVLLPTPWLVTIGVGSFAVAPWLKEELSGRLYAAGMDGNTVLLRFWDVLGAGAYYRLPTLLVWACLGALIVRWWRSRAYREGRVPVALVGALSLAAVLLALDRLDVVVISPYAGSYLQTTLSALLSVGVLAAALLLARAPSPWVTMLAVPGSMTLSLYVAQHAFLGWWARDGMSDDRWITLLVLTIGGTAVGLLWRRLPLPRVLQRGPLDGPVSWLSGRARDVVAGAERAPSRQAT